MSGGSGGGGNRGNGAAAGPIPAISRKLVQSVKEIVNCPESEIYSMLKECKMDPNEAVHRLLSQGKHTTEKSVTKIVFANPQKPVPLASAIQNKKPISHSRPSSQSPPVVFFLEVA